MALARVQSATVWTAWILILLAGCAEPPAAPVVEPSEPTDILIVNAAVEGRTASGEDSISAVLRNLGRSGTGRMQAWGSHVNPDSADVLLGESAPFEAPHNRFIRATWKVKTPTASSTSGVRYVTARSQDRGTGAFRQTSRRNFP